MSLQVDLGEALLLINYSALVKGVSSSQIRAYKGRFLGKQLSDGFTGPKESGQGSHHGEGDKGERGKRERVCTHREREKIQREGEKEMSPKSLY